MSWSVGYDPNWKRDIGYGVPATCDHPDCSKEIDRGLSYVCGGEPYGGEHGCGLFFCGEHLTYNLDDAGSNGRRAGETPPGPFCEHCGPAEAGECFDPKPDLPVWINHKLTDPSWQQWRDENPDEVEELRKAISQ
ncbi:hypothetical protein [Mycolicibacterium goodii]|uniref:hypothetical protein n=1 Tax=Mycolicibacterium goodii TaxID=134601 RepID=UPI001BDD3DB9|nr:hypothetical protein [Mycolicibacterium goodii]MBU8834154.1 hypothetical protein [Mycolicibacterium goodii]